jgi:carboxyl-terminal processing protease
MKFLKLSVCLILIYFSINTIAFSKNSSKVKQQAIITATYRSLQALHYQPKAVDDTLSKQIFNLFIERLDFSKRFFIESDIKELKKYEFGIDEAIINADTRFFDAAYLIWKQRLNEVELFFPSLLDKPIDLNNTDKFYADPAKYSYPKNITELKAAWYNSLEFQVIGRVYEMELTQNKQIEKKDTSLKKIKTLAEMEIDARAKVLKSTKDFFDRVKKSDEDDFFATYVNTITACFDPHTDFFPPKDKENFDIRMSGRLEGIGATLQEKDNYIKIVSLVVGGPSWKQGQLKPEDLLLKVAEGKSAEWTSLENMPVDDAVKHIRGKKGTTVRLWVRHNDGVTEEISIVRDVVVFEDTYAKSSIILLKGKKIGFIHLPEFYADFNNVNGRRCATDMKIEVEKLKADNVDGIVIDLRNNTGGSLSDVVDIAGLFIKKGPIVQVKSKEANPQVLYDTDENVVYTGPLAIMINEFSASASEILAAAIQDYHRGVIVGSPSSFGKGTVQRFYDLDNFFIPENDTIRPLGAIKITNQKFFRINGGTTQLKGVSSDIVLHDNLEFIEYGEQKEEFPLSYTNIAPANYTKFNNNYNLSNLKEQSKIRQNNSPIFAEYEASAHRIKKQTDEKVFSLNYLTYKNENEVNKTASKKLEELAKVENPINVGYLTADSLNIVSDTNKVTKIQAWHKTIKKDAYIFETLHIVLDIMMNIGEGKKD